MDKNKQKKRTALGNRLRDLRPLYGLSQREVAEKLYITRSSYAYYETGQTEPDLHTLCDIATLYQVSTDFLLGMEERTIFIRNIRPTAPAVPAASAPAIHEEAPPDS